MTQIINKSSPKVLFELMNKIGEGNHNNFACYETNEDFVVSKFRVDCGSIGSFDVIKLKGEEQFQPTKNDWVWVEGTIYKYQSLSAIYDHYPELSLQDAISFIEKQIKHTSLANKFK